MTMQVKGQEDSPDVPVLRWMSLGPAVSFFNGAVGLQLDVNQVKNNKHLKNDLGMYSEFAILGPREFLLGEAGFLLEGNNRQIAPSISNGWIMFVAGRKLEDVGGNISNDSNSLFSPSISLRAQSFLK